MTRSLIGSEQQSLAQLNIGQERSVVLLAVDAMQSPLARQAVLSAKPSSYQAYGYSTPQPSVATAFNGQPRDGLTGNYLLGTGYRAYNPVLMRFNSPDSWSPFGAGGCNGYAYAICDPVNHTDPTGHVRQVTKKPSMIRPSSLRTSSQMGNSKGSSLMSRSNSVASSTSESLTPSTPSSQGSSKINRYSSQSSLSSSLSDDDRAWALNKSNAQFKNSGLSNAEQRSFDTFQNAIHNFGLSPKNAASLVGGADYKQLDKNTNLYQIRLSQSQRVTFIVEGKVATIRQVGGHT